MPWASFRYSGPLTALAMASAESSCLFAKLGMGAQDVKPSNILLTREGTAKLADVVSHAGCGDTHVRSILDPD